MHGLFVISTMSDGGAQRVMSNLLMGLPESWRIDLLLNDDGPRDYPCRGRIISLGMQEEKNKQQVGYQFKVLMRRLRKLKELKRTEKYDFCVSFMDSANIANVLTPYGKTKSILSEHIYLSEACSHSATYRYLTGPMVRLLYNRADMIIAVSQLVKSDLVQHFHVHDGLCRVVYNGVYLFSGAKPKREDQDFVITTMGRLEEQKGQWHLIRVVALLAPKYPQLRLVILGEGSLHEKLENLAVRLGVEDRVSLPGFINQPSDVIASSDLFVFPSLYEGFANTLIEAMSCGVPVISSDHLSGAREILAPDTDIEKRIDEGIEWAEYGCLVPVSRIPIEEACNMECADDGEKSLYQAIERMILDKDLRAEYGKKAAARALDFSADKMAQGWMKALYQVCEKKA